MNKKEKIVVGIYKITNQTNGVAYVGQSINIYRRWREHKRAAKDKKKKEYYSDFGTALRTLGSEQFTFEIVEECSADILNEREVYWIAHFDTYNNGYNQTKGGKGTDVEPTETVLGIMRDLSETKRSHQEIADRWKVSKCTVDRINIGEIWMQPGIDYPIRKKVLGGKKHYCFDCGTEVSQKAKRCLPCSKLNRPNKKKKSLHTAHSSKKYVKSNICENCGAPITRQAKLCKNCNNIKAAKNIPSKDDLLFLILRYPFTQIGKKYGVTDNAVRKWCKKYNLPYKNNDIQHLRKEMCVTEYYPTQQKFTPRDDKYIKSVAKYDLEGNYIKTYTSVRCAAEELALEVETSAKLESLMSMISGCCLNKRKKTYGYKWQYVE